MSKKLSKKLKSQKNNKKSYFKNLSFLDDGECQKNIIHYHHPKNYEYYGIFPFIINYEEANKIIFNNLLSENNGLSIKEWLEQYNILKHNCKTLSKKISLKKTKKSQNKCSHHHHHKVNLFEPIQKEINYKLQSAVYELINSKSVINTFNYLFQKFGSGIYIQIKNGKIESFIPFINTNFVNEWANLVNLPKKYKNLEEYFLEKQKELGGKLRYIKNKDLWTASNCLLHTEKQNTTNINDSHWVEIYQMINETCKNHKIDDVDFFMNTKAFPLLRNDFCEPYEQIYGEGKFLTSHYYTSYHPILSVSTNDKFGDLPYPSAEDWRLITQEFFRNSCGNKYLYPSCEGHKRNFDDTDTETDNCHKHNLEWDDKENKLYFFGDSSNCGIGLNNNLRLKLIDLGSKHLDLMECSLTKFSKKDRINLETHEIEFDKSSDFKFNVNNGFDKGIGIGINLKSIKEGNHGKYKYLISVPSYGIDPELPFYLSLGALVFKVDNEYSTWYDHLLKPYQHYLPVKKDLSNLTHLIKWANTHQETCHKIARNGYIAFKKFFNRNNILEYWNYLLNSIAHHRLDLSSLHLKFQEYESKIKISNPKPFPPPDLESINFKDNKLGIIIPYYKLDSKYKIALKDIIHDLIHNFKKFPQLKYKIIICEQTRSNKKYNKGQLINLGLLIAKNEECTHIVINNLNTHIISEMIPYYFAFKEANKGIVNIGFNWTDFYQKKLLTDITLWNLDLLIKIGGYPNNIWGWGCSERIVYHRYFKYLNLKNQNLNQNKKLNESNLYIPIFNKKMERYDLSDWGQVIDVEYQQLKILGDWFLEKYNDLNVLEKYLDDIIKIKQRQSSRCHDIEHKYDSHPQINSHLHLHISENLEENKKYKNDLKVLDNHSHQKEVSHYTFKLLDFLENANAFS